MGQRSSSNGGHVPCCTSRGDDEARHEAYSSIMHDSSRPQASPRQQRPDQRYESNHACDGGTGGTGSGVREKLRRDDENMCSASRCGLTCVENRGTNFAAGRKAIFGDRALKPTLQKLRASEAEVETLMKIITSIDCRLPKQEGQAIPLPQALEVGATHISDIELVRRLRLHEGCLKGVAEMFITEACAKVLKMLSISGGTGSLAERPIELEEIKKYYADILLNIKTLLDERISQLNELKTKLSDEVSNIEDAIDTCFDQLVEDDCGTVSSDTFVSFMCEMDSGKHDFAISPQDAESLFVQMSDGGKELTYDQFKDEVTVGCLSIMQDNMELRRTMSKQYRDSCI